MPPLLPLPLRLLLLSSTTSRTFTTRCTPLLKWTGSTPSDHQTNERDSHNVQQDAVEKGQQDRAADSNSGGGSKSGSVATQEQASSKGVTQKSIEQEFPNKPKGPVIGLQDERGGKSS